MFGFSFLKAGFSRSVVFGNHPPDFVTEITSCLPITFLLCVKSMVLGWKSLSANVLFLVKSSEVIKWSKTFC